MIAGLILLSLKCTKNKIACPKEGYVFSNSTLKCWYTPETDSIPLGSFITLEGSLPKIFIDERTNVVVTNNAKLVEGPLGIGMIYPTFQAAVDSFQLAASIGKVIKDTIQFSETMLKGFRTIQWDASSADSFKIKLSIKPLAKGIYSLALKQQTGKDDDCAIYKYFLKVGNSDQHLNYWLDATGNISGEVRFYSYCFKVY